jgi:hypothetical protein
LNWQLQVDPLTLSMTSLPPTVPPDGEVPDEDFDELEPHAASSVQVAATNTIHRKRFIELLRSHCDECRRLTGSEFARFAARDHLGNP